MYRWFINHTKAEKTAKPVADTVIQKPRATNAIDIFTKAQKAEISARMKARRDAESLTPQQSNLNFHCELKAQMFDKLDPETRANFEAQVATHNKMLEEGPGQEHIYK
jgi:hypothetical protein